MNPIRKKANVPSSSARSFFVSMIVRCLPRSGSRRRAPAPGPSLPGRPAAPLGRPEAGARRAATAAGARPDAVDGSPAVWPYSRAMTRRTLVGPLLVAAARGRGPVRLHRRAGPGTPVASSRRRPVAGAAGAATASAASRRRAVPSSLADRATDAQPDGRRRASPSAARPRPRPPATSPALAAQLQKALDRFAAANRLPGVERHDHLADGRSWTGTTRLRRRQVAPSGDPRHGLRDREHEQDVHLGAHPRARRRRQAPPRHEGRYAPAQGPPRDAAGTPIPAGVTVRMLLDHTSGLADYFFGKGIDKALMASRGATWTAAQALAYVGKPLGKPGTFVALLEHELPAPRARRRAGDRDAVRQARSPAAARSGRARGRLRPGGRAADRSARARLLLQPAGPERPGRSASPTLAGRSFRSPRS